MHYLCVDLKYQIRKLWVSKNCNISGSLKPPKMDNLKNKTVSAIYWSGIFSAISFLLHFGASVIIARILFPEDFGLMGIVLLTTKLVRLLSDYGFMLVIVQKRQITAKHYETAFLINLCVSILMTVILILLSNTIALFFNQPQLSLILKVVSVAFIIRAFVGVPFAILARSMKFKERGLITTVTNFSRIVVALTLAILGFGVWSLVFGNLVGTLVNAVGATWYSKWFPKIGFDKSAFNDMLSFGIWAYLNSFVTYFTENIDYIVIGKLINAYMLGCYERAYNIVEMPRKRIQRIMNQLLFSAYSKRQDDPASIANALTQVSTVISIIIYPTMIWLFFASPSLIINLYGEKWSLTVYPLQIMCISGLLNTLTMIFIPLLLARGKINVKAKISCIYLLVLISAIYFFLPWGINGVAWAVVLASFVQYIIMLSYSLIEIKLTIKKYLRSQKPALIYGFFQISAILFFQITVSPHIDKESLIMLTSICLISVISITVVHIALRLKEVDYVLAEYVIGPMKKKFKKNDKTSVNIDHLPEK